MCLGIMTPIAAFAADFEEIAEGSVVYYEDFSSLADANHTGKDDSIGEAVNMSNNTVKKYVRELEKKGLITTEYTTVKTKDGRTHNGSLRYTLRPIQPIEEAYFQKKIREAEAAGSNATLIAHYKYVYDGDGNIVRFIDISGKKEYNYEYEEGRIIRST